MTLATGELIEVDGVRRWSSLMELSRIGTHDGEPTGLRGVRLPADAARRLTDQR